MSLVTTLVTALAAFACSAVLTRVVLAWLHHRQILDHPNERSSHSLPIPRGGGLGVGGLGGGGVGGEGGTARPPNHHHCHTKTPDPFFKFQS